MADLKQKKKFEENWKKVKELSGTETPEKQPKVSKDTVSSILTRVAEQRRVAAELELEGKIVGIYDAKIALDKSLAKGRKELEQKEEKEYEELNKQLDSAFGMFEQVRKDAGALASAADGNLSISKEEEEDNKP
jgi:hypothetical protein